MATFLTRSFNLSLAPYLPLLIAAAWCYFFYDVNLGIPPFAFRLLVLAAIAGWFFLYRDMRFRMTITGKDVCVLGGLIGLNLIVHWNGLFLPIGGDELYHSGQSIAVLRAFQAYADSLPSMSSDELRSSMANTFDLRHIAVIDLWRLFAFAALSAGVVFLVITRKLSSAKSKGILTLCTLAVLAVAGTYVAPGPEVHPPLRTLPLFLSALVLGLSDFAFRLPAVIAVSVAAWALYLYQRFERPTDSLLSVLPMAIMSCFIPQVFYIAECVEPSVWGYFTCALLVVHCLTVVRFSSEQGLIGAGLVAGLAIILRQSTIVLWIPVLALLVSHRRFWTPLFAARIFAPGLIALPYMISTRRIGHVAETAGKSNPFASVYESIVSGIGPLSILNSTSIPWLAFFAFLVATSIRRTPWRERAIFLWFIPAYSVFYTVWPYLWGIGRYQVEYVAPFIILAGLLHFSYAGVLARRVSAFILVPLSFFTVEIHRNVSLDTSYNEWPKMRITTSAHFPYREAVRFLKQHETFGRFVILGGTPLNGDFVLWLHGMSFSDAKTWRDAQEGFQTLLSTNSGMDDIFKYVQDKRLVFLVIQGGSRRENQHRSPEISNIITKLEQVPLHGRTLFFRTLTLLGEEGGTLTFYSPKVPK